MERDTVIKIHNTRICQSARKGILIKTGRCTRRVIKIGIGGGVRYQDAFVNHFGQECGIFNVGIALIPQSKRICVINRDVIQGQVTVIIIQSGIGKTGQCQVFDSDIRIIGNLNAIGTAGGYFMIATDNGKVRPINGCIRTGVKTFIGRHLIQDGFILVCLCVINGISQTTGCGRSL